MSKSKKAQVTIAIIIGLVLIAGAAVTFYVTKLVPAGEELEEIARVPAEVEPIKAYIDDCIKINAIPAVRLMAGQGGYISLPDDYYSFEGNDVAYLYDAGESKVPTVTEMEAQLELYMDAAVVECIGEFEVFKEQGFDITATDIITNAEINENNIVFRVAYPVQIKKGEFSTEISQFRYVSDLRLGYLHGVAADIVGMVAEDPDYIDMGYLESFKLEISIIPGGEDVILYSIKDGEFLFLLAARYTVNHPPEIEGESEETFRIKDNALFEYKINAVDEGAVVLEDDTPMFDIEQDGWIRFTPDVTGTFEVEITATDEQGKKAKKKLILIIEEE